jgi:2-polyprenyl-3-methyl-5-hydroxy-6-metoxy-1,4-benzoquinol methylase
MTSEYWDKKVSDVEDHVIKGWLDWQFIEDEYIRPQVSGDRSVYYLQHFISTHLPQAPVQRALSLGCGGGNLERALISLNAAQSIDACDLSVESIRLAQSLAQAENIGDRITYQARDIDTIELPVNTYDFVIIKMALHHFERLEHIFAQIAKSLKPGGVLVFNEFVGPSRYQWTDLQLQLMNVALKLLPQENTHSVWTQDYLREISRPTVEEMIALDPTEAVRSDDIMTVLADYFELLEYKPYGGTILHILLTHIMASFDVANPDDQARLRGLFQFEKTMIENGFIGSDFAYVVAKPRNVVSASTPIPEISDPMQTIDDLQKSDDDQAGATAQEESVSHLRYSLQGWNQERLRITIRGFGATLNRIPLIGHLFRMVIRVRNLGKVWGAESVLLEALVQEMESIRQQQAYLLQLSESLHAASNPALDEKLQAFSATVQQSTREMERLRLICERLQSSKLDADQRLRLLEDQLRKK